MTAWAWVLISVAIAACASRTPTARERALEKLPSNAQVVAVADGPAVATPTFRRVIDVSRSHFPAKLGCVIDAAQTGEAVAVAVTPGIGTTIVLVTRAVVANCPALSRIGADLWIATIGDGALASDRTTSVLADARWTRARPYLEREPIAIAALGNRSLLAVAQPEPLDAWVALEAPDIDIVERAVKQQLERWTTKLAALADKLRVSREGVQLVVRGDQLVADDLVAIASELLTLVDAAPAAAPPAAFVCPAALPQRGLVSCTAGTRFVVSSLPQALQALTAAASEPVISGGDVLGVRLTADAPLVLRRGDIILGVDSHRVTSTEQLGELVQRPREQAILAVRRDGSDVVLELKKLQ